MEAQITPVDAGPVVFARRAGYVGESGIDRLRHRQNTLERRRQAVRSSLAQVLEPFAVLRPGARVSLSLRDRRCLWLRELEEHDDSGSSNKHGDHEHEAKLGSHILMLMRDPNGAISNT